MSKMDQEPAHKVSAAIERPGALEPTAGFSAYVQERLGYYVYLLSDPQDKRIFYVGKGKGNRIFAHAKDALDDEHESDKLERIREIRNSGHQVGHELLRFGLTEKTAFDMEVLSDPASWTALTEPTWSTATTYLVPGGCRSMWRSASLTLPRLTTSLNRYC